MGEGVAEAVDNYIAVSVFSYFINGIAGAFSTLLWSSGYGTTITVIDTVFHLLYVWLVGLAILYFDRKDLTTIAWIGVGHGLVYGLFVFVYVYINGILDDYWKGMFRKLALKNTKLIDGVLKMSIPLSLGSLLAYGEWETFTIFSTLMGPAEVAAWSLAGEIWGIFEYLPGGFGDASELRVAFHLGNGNPRMAKIAAYKCLLYSLLWVSLCNWFFIYHYKKIVQYFTHDETLTAMLYELVILISIGNVLMCLGSEANCIISAQGRAKLSTWIYFLCTWVVTIPLGLYFVVVQNYGLQSMVTTIIIGYANSCLLLFYMVFTSNWAKISKEVMTALENAEGSSDEIETAYKYPDVPIV